MFLQSLQTLLREGGPIMPLILLAALIGYVLAIERLLSWGRWHFSDRPLLRAASARGLEALLERPAGPRSPLASLLRSGLAHRILPAARREAAMHLEVLTVLPRVEARIATIGWLGGILPMLGLLGTVSGMIATFKELSLAASRQALSVGLSEALWTTEVGLLGALPLLAVHHLLTRLRSRWLNRLELGLALLFGEGPGGAAGGESGAAAPGAAATGSGEAHEGGPLSRSPGDPRNSAHRDD